ncbi:secretory phospholipase A2 receptor-like isoform X2 [Simochromis diagramma]|uniref:secretory phospholipase A2 receptor-like isoform X2 n=1 Tax=Simochromis diagramma TaxID=43689 RepID=UPI001A7EB0FE|nr:secretory phospholipase A2 receptor-like isoform X2 [Simochromis diagramma]
MELLSPLSLLLATVQLHFVFSSYVYPNAGDLEIGNLTWKLECCMSNRKQFTLKIVAQKLDSLDSMYSMYSSGTCPGTNYRERKCLNSSLAVENVSLHNKSKSWIDALEDCQKDHFSLVEICEKKVRDDVKRLQNKTDSKTGVWIGLQRSIFGYRPEWKWISGYNVVKSQLNRALSTNSDFDNHCGKVIFDNKTEEIKWSNADCHEKLPYICQRMNEKPCTDEYTEKSELFIDID